MSSYLPYITGPLGALAALVIGITLIIIGKLHTDGEFQAKVAELKEAKDENRDLKAALEIERTTNNELARAGQVTTKVLDVLAEVATGRLDHHEQHPAVRREDAGAAAKDPGL